MEKTFNGETHEFKFTGVWIPKEVVFDERLSFLEMMLYSVIHSLEGDEGCFASNAYLAKMCRRSEVQIGAAVSKLKKYGYVYQAKFDGRKRWLKVGRPAENHGSDSLKTRRQTHEKQGVDNIDDTIVDRIEEKKSKDGDVSPPTPSGRKSANINLSPFITISKKLVETQMKRVPGRYRRYSEKEIRNMIRTGGEELEKICRLDKYSIHEIENTLQWAIEDEFWQKNIFSCSPLRYRNPADPERRSKFDKIYDQYQVKKTYNNKGKKKKLDSFENRKRGVMPNYV